MHNTVTLLCFPVKCMRLGRERFFPREAQHVIESISEDEENHRGTGQQIHQSFLLLLQQLVGL